MRDGMPIRMLSELTGVAATTLRAWERRYQLLEPRRTPKGHRLYNPEDVALVKEVVAQLQSGISISEAIRQLRQAEPQNPTNEPPSQWPTLQRRLLQAVELFDEAKLDAVYNEALSLYPFGLVSQSLILPVLNTLGERWQQRLNGIAEEHFFSTYLRNKLGARLHHEAARKHGSRLLLACLPGEFHEIGVLLFAIEALAHGYRVLYLGPNVPLSQLPAVAERARAEAIVLSGTSAPLLEVTQQWPALQQTTLPVLVGGRFSVEQQAWLNEHGATTLGNASGASIERLMNIVPPYRRTGA